MTLHSVVPDSRSPVVLRAALALIALLPSALSAQRALPPPEHRAPVALTISGGKSLGSYQAGVNWGLIQGMKHSVEAGHGAHARPYELLAVTGASAGNINALISAVEWCDQGRLAPPEESLFFKIWVRTGWEQLLTPAPYRLRSTEHRSVLHRDFFERHFEEIDRALEGADAAPCDVPIGITLTKQVRGTIALGALDIPTQRFVSIVRLVSVEEAGRRRLAFALPESSLLADSAIGKRVWPTLPGSSRPAVVSPAAVAGGGGSGRETAAVVPSKLAYQLSAASSAFPLAFEPERLDVVDPERAAAGCEVSTELGCRASANYLDGGLFDNSPLDLALHLFDHRRPVKPLTAADTLARVVYIEAGEYRGHLRSVRARDAEAERFGTAAALQMVSQAIPAARKYELHALARSLRADPGSAQAGWLRVTDRSFPIVGEHLAGFAAFLGRPFREFDFYVGVYDALHFIVADLCPDEHDRDALKRAAAEPCEGQRLRELIEDDGLRLGPYAPAVLSELYAVEFPDEPRPRVSWPEGDDGRSLILQRLIDANRRVLDGVDQGCSGRGTIERLVCSGGFDEILRALREDDAVMDVIDDWAEREACDRDAWMTAQVEGCLADYTFRELVRNPPLFMSRTAEQVLRQMWRVEAGLAAEDESNTAEVVQLIELWFRSAWGKYQDAWDTDPSTIPDGETFWNWLFHLAPNQLAVAAGTKGGDIWGLRPTYHLGPRWALVAPLSLTFNRPVENPDERWRLHGGFGLLRKSESLLLSGYQLTADVLRAPRWRIEDAPDRTAWGTSLTAYLFAGKVTTTVRWMPGNDSELYSGDDVAVILGLADFNGLLYWISRGLF
ncbi:MAG: patatin-like phospholipase family protein [Gemmatimonadetes bacterium]|nr:patatin-like phospholipase family protein [Gemmatimonadota bacterium]